MAGHQDEVRITCDKSNPLIHKEDIGNVKGVCEQHQWDITTLGRGVAWRGVHPK